MHLLKILQGFFLVLLLNAYGVDSPPIEIDSSKGHGYFGLLTGISFRYPEHASEFYKSFFVGSVTGIFGGYDFNRWKLELEVSDIENAVNLVTSRDKNHTTSQEGSITIMGNGYYVPFDFKIARPYVGAGVGYAIHSFVFQENNPVKKDDVFDFSTFRKYANGFSYQAIAGIEFLLSNSVNLDLEYRFWGASSHLASNLLLLKLTYKFP